MSPPVPTSEMPQLNLVDIRNAATAARRGLPIIPTDELVNAAISIANLERFVAAQAAAAAAQPVDTTPAEA